MKQTRRALDEAFAELVEVVGDFSGIIGMVIVVVLVSALLQWLGK